jgi:hypothetical protein
MTAAATLSMDSSVSASISGTQGGNVPNFAVVTTGAHAVIQQYPDCEGSGQPAILQGAIDANNTFHNTPSLTVPCGTQTYKTGPGPDGWAISASLQGQDQVDSSVTDPAGRVYTDLGPSDPHGNTVSATLLTNWYPGSTNGSFTGYLIDASGTAVLTGTGVSSS